MPLTDAQTDALLEAARARQGEIVALLQRLVRTRSINGQDAERAVAELIIEEAGRLGFDAELVAADPERPNALVRWGDGPAGFVLIGHIDTVPPGDIYAWSHPPFGGDLAGGRLYGRGAADNKAGLACGLYTLALLRDLDLLDPAEVAVFVAGVSDEESGASSTLGVRYLLDEGRLPVQGAIYTYTSDIVCVGHRGLLRFELTARGQSIHTGSPAWSRGEGGANAVTGLADLLLRLEALDLPAPEHPAFAGLGCKLTPGTLIEGGEFESLVPASASAMVDVRLMPGQPAAQVLEAVQREIDAVKARRPGLHIDLTIKNDLPGAAIPVDHRLAQLAQHHAERITGREWPIAGAGPANEGYMLIGAGIPTLPGFGPTGGGAHSADEWVEVDSLAETVAIYSAIIHDSLS